MSHIVDTLIEERAQQLMAHPVVWQFVKRVLYPVLGYRSAIRMADTIQNMSGLAVFEHLSEALAMDVRCTGLDHLPARGPAIVVANHPAGIADGVAVFDALKRVRSDITFFANRDAIRVAPRLAEEMIVPVEWVDDKRTRQRNKETVRHVVQAFRAQRAVVIFPSGRLARLTLRGLHEREWTSTAVSLAQKYQCPMVPMHVHARNSWLYYLFHCINTELRDITLFRELLNKTDQRYRIILGAPFQAEGDPRATTLALREFIVDQLPLGQSRFNLPDT